MPAENGLQFVDTNLLVYAYDLSSGEKNERAKALVKQLWFDRIGCLSIQVLQEFYVSITRKVLKPLSSEKASDIVHDLSTWKVYVPDPGDVLKAIKIEQKYHLSFWDAMIIQSASASGCQVIWSEDFNPSQTYEGIKVQNPLAA